MIAYRAETAMVQIVRQKMKRHDDARSLLRAIYSTEADILPDPQAKTLSPSASTRLPTNPPTMGHRFRTSLRSSFNRNRNIIPRNRAAPEIRIGVGSNSLKRP